MLKNKKERETTSKVKFVSYTGEYPNLCSGVLTLEIDGVQYKFGHNFMEHHYDKDGNGYYADEDPMNPNFNAFWSSGGCVTHDDDWNFEVDTDEWAIDVNELPEQFRDVAAEIDEVFNENVDWGCCGGCV